MKYAKLFTLSNFFWFPFTLLLRFSIKADLWCILLLHNRYVSNECPEHPHYYTPANVDYIFKLSFDAFFYQIVSG